MDYLGSDKVEGYKGGFLLEPIGKLKLFAIHKIVFVKKFLTNYSPADEHESAGDPILGMVAKIKFVFGIKLGRVGMKRRNDLVD